MDFPDCTVFINKRGCCSPKLSTLQTQVVLSNHNAFFLLYTASAKKKKKKEGSLKLQRAYSHSLRFLFWFALMKTSHLHGLDREPIQSSLSAQIFQLKVAQTWRQAATILVIQMQIKSRLFLPLLYLQYSSVWNSENHYVKRQIQLWGNASRWFQLSFNFFRLNLDINNPDAHSNRFCNKIHNLSYLGKNKASIIKTDR